jgi:hypothetical protein
VLSDADFVLTVQSVGNLVSLLFGDASDRRLSVFPVPGFTSVKSLRCGCCPIISVFPFQIFTFGLNLIQFLQLAYRAFFSLMIIISVMYEYETVVTEQTNHTLLYFFLICSSVDSSSRCLSSVRISNISDIYVFLRLD